MEKATGNEPPELLVMGPPTVEELCDSYSKWAKKVVSKPTTGKSMISEIGKTVNTWICLRWFFYGFDPMGFITIWHHYLGEYV